MVNLLVTYVAIVTVAGLGVLMLTSGALSERDTDDVQRYLLSHADMYGQHLIRFLYGIYLRFTLLNVMIFLVKYLPTGYYIVKFVRTNYVSSRQRVLEKQRELEDIRLKIEIVNTKLYVRDAEFSERAGLLRREKERLRGVRARVRGEIAGGDALRQALDATDGGGDDSDMHIHVHTSRSQEDDTIMALLKGFRGDISTIPDRLLSDKLECRECVSESDVSPSLSVYSSLSDTDARQDCCVKIVKVTNVYKVAYWKHYIKQKRLRRANKRAVLKKKIENIKSLMEGWQNALNVAINRGLINVDVHPMDVASQEAMGDYSKPQDQESLSDSDLRSCNDSFHDEYGQSWVQNPYRPYLYNYEDVSDTLVSREYYQDGDNGDVRYNAVPCEGATRKMLAIVEETGSQLAIEEVTSVGTDDDYCGDDVEI